MSQIHIHRHRVFYRIKYEIENIFGDVVGLGVILLMISLFILAMEFIKRSSLEIPTDLKEEL